MLARMMASYGKRIGDDPAASLPHLRELETALTDATNHGLYLANKVGGRSINDLAGMLGVSKQAIFKRVGLGAAIARQREKRQRRPAGISSHNVQVIPELPPGRESTG